MEELREKANCYAEENVINVLKEAFAKVYADGYRDGYKDRENEIPVDLRLSQTEFIDLGLPSGTLWANDYEKDGEDCSYMSFEIANTNQIPTIAQWKELRNMCKWEFIGEGDELKMAKCIGPNGNFIVFYPMGRMDFVKRISKGRVFFWVKTLRETNIAVHLWLYKNEGHEDTEIQVNLRLPVRLVKSK